MVLYVLLASCELCFVAVCMESAGPPPPAEMYQLFTSRFGCRLLCASLGVDTYVWAWTLMRGHFERLLLPLPYTLRLCGVASAPCDQAPHPAFISALKPRQPSFCHSLIHDTGTCCSSWCNTAG